MRRLRKPVLVAVIQVLLVCSMGVKFAIDRATLPRVWARVVPFDPDLPIRGRYVRLRLEATPRGFPETLLENQNRWWGSAVLSVEDGKLIATKNDRGEGRRVALWEEDGELHLRLQDPIAFFITEHVPDPSRQPNLRAEVTVPRKGPPRPIRLGVEEGGEITPLDLK